jgi:hypothetical protein
MKSVSGRRWRGRASVAMSFQWKWRCWKEAGSWCLTGQMGEIMQESAKAALTYARSVIARLGLRDRFNEKTDVHIHVPAGAIPKDGPSAGVTIAVALVSALTGLPVRHEVGMTGEITLRGKVLPVGGIKEKLLGAHRGRIESRHPAQREREGLARFATENHPRVATRLRPPHGRSAAHRPARLSAIPACRRPRFIVHDGVTTYDRTDANASATHAKFAGGMMP